MRVDLSTGCQKGRSGINRQHQVREQLGDRHLIETSAKVVNRYFAEENLRMANQRVKRCLTSKVVRTMLIKVTVRCHFISKNQSMIISSLDRVVGNGIPSE